MDAYTRLNFKRKKTQYVSNLTCPFEILDHLQAMGSYPSRVLLDFDETSCSREKFQTPYGVGPAEIVIHEWTLDGKLLSAIALYSSIGFLFWKISLDPFNSESIKKFIQENVSQFILEENVLIFDGASTHLTTEVVDATNTVTHGKYKKVPAYAHFLSPTEKGFSNVWGLVRQRWSLNPSHGAFNTLNDCFEYYSYRGVGGSMAIGNFKVYDNNHEYWLLNEKC